MTNKHQKKRTFICALAAASMFVALPTFAADDDAKTDPAQLARGAKAWSDNCGRCHNLRAPKELTDEEWDVSVTHMRVRANLPGDLADDIIEFLKASN